MRLGVLPLAALANLVLGPSGLRAQVNASPGTIVNGRVAVRVFVSLSDSSTRYYPVTGHRLFFYRTAADSTNAVTDSSGALSILLAPGDYRLVSDKTVKWHGAEYAWNVPLAVRAGMDVVDLRVANAVHPSTAVATLPIGPGTDTPRLAGRDSTGDVVLWKDPKRARQLSWYWAGAGHIYAGHDGQGYALAMLDGVFGVMGLVGVTVAMNCGVYDCNGSEKGLIAAGLIGSLALSAYAANDAEAIVRRENEANRLGVLHHVTPRVYVAESAHGKRYGLAFSVAP